MGFNIEISINLLKNTNVTEIKNDVIHWATHYNCQEFYSFSETEGMLKNPICKYIVNIEFSEKSMPNLLDFIKNMKTNKNVHIECIYANDVLSKLIYASQVYLKTLHKDSVNNYKSFKRQRSYSEDEQMILQEF